MDMFISEKTTYTQKYFERNNRKATCRHRARNIHTSRRSHAIISGERYSHLSISHATFVKKPISKFREQRDVTNSPTLLWTATCICAQAKKHYTSRRWLAVFQGSGTSTLPLSMWREQTKGDVTNSPWVLPATQDPRCQVDFGARAQKRNVDNGAQLCTATCMYP